MKEPCLRPRGVRVHGRLHYIGIGRTHAETGSPDMSVGYPRMRHKSPMSVAGTEAIQATHELPIAIMPDHPDHLHELIDIALGSDWGHPTPERDEDGDIPYFCDSTVVFVRVVADAPVIRIFCELVVEVEDLESGAFEVAVLNRDHSAVKFVLRDTRILMSIDLPALPFAPEHLRTILSGMCELAPKIDADLAHRVRGRRFFEPSTDEAA